MCSDNWLLTQATQLPSGDYQERSSSRGCSCDDFRVSLMNLSIGIDSIFADHKFLFLTPVKRVLGNRFEDRIN
jgi:hypothetical protein